MSSSVETSASHVLLNHQQESSVGGKETVSHSLLSTAKDVRYMEKCYRLLLENMQSIKQPSSSRSSEAMIKRSSMLLSAVLYILIVIRPSRRTLGMEVCGVKFRNSRQGLVRQLLSTVFGWYILDTLVDKVRNNHTIENQESLRGTNRMEMHRRLRRQMMERAQSHTQSLNDVQPNPSQTARNAISNPHFQRLATLIGNSLRGSLDQSEGPHSLETQEALFDSRLSLIGWILRLHMAHYCVTGTYPTVIHRLLRLHHVADASTDISSRPETSRIVALLIGVQAGASLVRYILNLSAEAVAEILESRRVQLSMLASTRSLEQSVFKKISLRSDIRNHSYSTCGICRLERKHAAASIHCGHVFCWNCLYQWISTVKEACPLCRRPCRTHDIVFLHNYEQPR